MKIKENKARKVTKCMVLQHDTAGVHTCRFAVDTVKRKRVQSFAAPTLFTRPSSQHVFSLPKLENRYAWTQLAF